MPQHQSSSVRPQLTPLEDRVSPSSFGLDSIVTPRLIGDDLSSSAGAHQAALFAHFALSGNVPQANPNGNGTGSIIPLASSPYGESYGQWSANWWQWVFSMPSTSNDLLDNAPPSANQSGNVWYLGGSFTNVQQETRNLTLPAGTSLFFPVVNVEVDNIGGPPPGTTYQGPNLTDAQLRLDAQQFMDQTLQGQTPFVKIDGVSVPNLLDYRVQSPVFTLTMPDNNLYQYFGLPAPAGTTSHAVSDGIYLMVPPLPVGQHTIEIGASLPSNNGQPQFAFDITYQINVVPGHA